MKKITLFIVVFLSLNCRAQFGKNPIINDENFDKKRIHYGYYLGFNDYEFKFDYKTPPTTDIEVQSSVGFNVGLIANLRLHEYVNLRFEPGLCFNQRNLTFPGFAKQYDAFREVKSTYLHFPLLLKFSSERIGNIRPYLLGGLGAAMNLASNETVENDNKNGTFRMTSWTQFYEIGIGIDLYFEYFKFSPSIRGVFSVGDELIRDNDPNSQWTSNIESMKTRGVFINFAFH